MKSYYLKTLFNLSLMLLLMNHCNVTYGFETRVISSSILNQKKTITLSLPENVNQSGQKYPLIIVLDGKDFFSLVSATCSYYSSTGKMPYAIIAGVHSLNRWKDYTPTHANIPDGTPVPDSGGGKEFSRFITKELIPQLNKEFNLSPFVLIFGHSIGGLESLYCLMNSSSISAAIATSPSMWWDNEYMSVKLSDFQNKITHTKYLYFTMGNEGATMMEPAQRFLESLKKNSSIPIKWEFRHFEDADHQVAPFKALPYALEFVFGDWQIPSDILSKGLDSVDDYYTTLSRKYKQKITVPESIYNRLGYIYLGNGDIDNAIKVFNLNIINYPDSANVYDSMGDALIKKNLPEQAAKNFKKSLILNPNNTHACDMLKQIENGEK